MNMDNVRKALIELKKKADVLIFSDETVINLLTAVAEHLIREEKVCRANTIPENYVNLHEFETLYGFIAANTLSRYCSKNPTVEGFSIYDGKRWLVDPIKTVEFFRTHPHYKRRLELPIFKEKLSQV